MRKISILLLLIILLVGCGTSVTAFADTVTTSYTTALQDLQRDTAFDPSKYPSEANSVKLDVIQIAESVNKELFLYVYQPGGDCVTASSVKISQDDEAIVKNNKSWLNFKLQLLDGDGVFFKYKVLGITLKTDTKRYYDITNIYSPVNTSTGELGNVVNALSNEVAKCFIAEDVDGNVEYHAIQTEVVCIINKLCGSFHYSNGFFLFGENACDSHWVAFSTDRDIDQLYEATVSYYVKEMSHSTIKNFLGIVTEDRTSVLNEEERTVPVKYSDTGGNTPDGGIFSYQYEWNRIESAEEFVKENKLTSEAKSAFKKNNYQWVLRFYESPYLEMPGFVNRQTLEYWDEVSEVTILDLYFRTGVKLYKLGVVDNKQSGDRIPDNTDTKPIDGAKKTFEEWWEDFVESWNNFWVKVKRAWDKYMWLFIVGMALIALAIVCAVVRPVWHVVKKALKGIWWVITLPVRLVVLLFGKKDGSD